VRKVKRSKGGAAFEGLGVDFKAPCGSRESQFICLRSLDRRHESSYNLILCALCLLMHLSGCGFLERARRFLMFHMV
jgi:hypothetical protein